MSFDSAWFKKKIEETPQGSGRQFAPTLKNQLGKPMDQASLSRIVNGTQELTLFEAVQMARAFGVSLNEIVRRAGLKL